MLSLPNKDLTSLGRVSASWTKGQSPSPPPVTCSPRKLIFLCFRYLAVDVDHDATLETKTTSLA